MNFKYFIFFFILFIGTSSFAQKIEAYLSYCRFYSPEKGPYLETYLSVSGNTVNYVKNAQGKWQGKVEVTLSFRQGDSIRYIDKYNLLSPETDDPYKVIYNFLDQQRIFLPGGEYVCEVSLTDKNKVDSLATHPEKHSVSFHASEKIKLEDLPDSVVSISGLELLESMKPSLGKSIISKAGYDLVPNTLNYYPTEQKSLKFYAELYHCRKVFQDEKFVVIFFIQSAGSRKVWENTTKIITEHAHEVNVVLADVPIESLPSGNYNLVVEVRNKMNHRIAVEDVFFQRSNKESVKLNVEDEQWKKAAIENTFAARILNRDTLADDILSLHPISSKYEIIFAENQLKTADLKLMQQYFYSFWKTRSEGNPEGEWIAYNQLVQKVNASYGTRSMRGYETDRGRVYLQYGAPNIISESKYEPMAYPYEIWQYYTLKTQTNRKFIFYEPDGIVNDYILLHSDAIGEVSDPDWQSKINRSNMNGNMSNPSNPGNKVNDIFQSPR